MDHCNSVLKQFFHGFYHNRINDVYNDHDSDKRSFDLVVLQFWCSVIVFYGVLCDVDKTNLPVKKNCALTLTPGKSFETFIQDFFPSPENKLGKFIYSIFRCGVVHQMAPKKSTVQWEHS